MDFKYLLRVPIIFFMDEIFKSNFELANIASIMFPVNNTLDEIEIGEPTLQYYKVLIKIILSCLMFCSSLCLLILPAKYLCSVYLQVISVYVVFFSYWKNIQTLEILSGENKNFKIDMANELITWDVDGYVIIFIQLYPRLYKLFCSLILQYCLSLVFDTLQVLTTNNSIHKVFRYSFIIPTLIVSIPNTNRILNIVTILSTLLQLFILLKTLFLNIFTIKNLILTGYNHIKEIINVFGILIVVQFEWRRLKLSSVFRVFWVIRVLIQVLNLGTNTEINNFTLFEAVKYFSIKGCDTCTAVLGMACLISYFCDVLEKFFHWVLLMDEPDDLNCGNITVTLFIILTMMSGLTNLDPENRWIKLHENFHYVCLNIRNYIFSMVDDLLKDLNDSFNRSLKKHTRALLVCGFLIALAVTTLYCLLSFYHSVDLWIVAVSVLNILSIMKILESLAVYSLLLIDSNCSKCWENIDDYVYYINSFGNIFEFCFCIFVLLIDVYIMVFVSGGVIRASMICIKVYSEVCNARKRWRKFIKRRKAVKKVESLPDATSIQLFELNDVCAICFQKMKSAKITKCNHYFHSKCLLKWTYLQDKCPLCHSI